MNDSDTDLHQRIEELECLLAQAREEEDRLRCKLAAAYDRIAAQSEIISRRAER